MSPADDDLHHLQPSKSDMGLDRLVQGAHSWRKRVQISIYNLGFGIGGGGWNEHNCMYVPSTLPNIDDCFHDFFHNGHNGGP
jgi:hypothetical protein